MVDCGKNVLMCRGFERQRYSKESKGIVPGHMLIAMKASVFDQREIILRTLRHLQLYHLDSGGPREGCADVVLELEDVACYTSGRSCAATQSQSTRWFPASGIHTRSHIVICFSISSGDEPIERHSTPLLKASSASIEFSVSSCNTVA